MVKKKLIQGTIFSALLPTLLLSATPAVAAVRCETQYGGGQVCVRTGNIQINKQVQGTDGVWYDNLGHQSGVRFKAGDIVTYRLHVSNVGDAKFDTVTVTDTLPSQLQLTDSNLTNKITNLEAGQSQDIFVKGKVVTSSTNMDCNVINVAEARTNDNQSDKDTAQICIQEGSAPTQVKTLPKAGANENIIALVLSASALLAGTFLIKNAKARL